MQCDEQDSKVLLAGVGIPTPPGRVVGTAAEARQAAEELGRVFVKALTTSTSRAVRGGVLRSDTPEEAAVAFDKVTSGLEVAEARVEGARPVDVELYFSAGFMPGGHFPELVLSASGGSGIEDRVGTLHRVAVDPLVGLSDFHVRRLLAAAGLPTSTYFAAVEPIVRGCYQLICAGDALMVELNPLGVVNAQAIALDGRITLDDYAAFRQPSWSSLRAHQQRMMSDEGKLTTVGIAYVPLSGNIGVVGLGAGLTMQLADWITNYGGHPQFFFDATAAAVRDHASLFEGRSADGFTSALRFGLGRVLQDTDVLLVNFTSGGTPVDGLAASLLAALSDLEWNGQVVVHVAGNRQLEATRVLQEAGVTPQRTLGDAVRVAVSKGAA